MLVLQDEKDFENVFKNEIKRAYEHYRSPRSLLYLAWLFDFSSKTTNDMQVLFVPNPSLKEEKK